MRPFPFKVWFWYTFHKHWDGECLVLAPYSYVLGTQPTSFPDTRICILFLKVLPAATPAHWYWLPRWGLWAPRAMAHLFIVPLLWIINKGIFHSLSTKIRRIPEAVGSLNLYFFSHLIVVQMEVIHCVNVCLLFSFYCMHFYFSLSSVFPSHVAQKIKQGAPNYLIFGLIKFSCSALCWWECVDDERWWDFPFFPPPPFRKSSPLERSQVTSVLWNLPKLSQSVFGATVNTSGRAHLLNFSFVHFPPSSLMMILWLLPVPFPPLMFSVGASPGLLSWLPLDSTWMTSSSPLVFNDHLYLNSIPWWLRR